MKAVLKKSNHRALIIYLILALIWSGLSVFMFAQNRLSGIGDIISCSLITIIICFFGVLLFLYNYKAYLHIDDHKISGRFGFFKRLECEINDVDFILVQFDTIHILLKDRKYCIRGVKNAHEIGSFIMPRLPFLFDGNKQDIIEDLKKRERAIKKNTILTFCAVGLSFVWLFATVFLTDQRELSEFNHTDWILFSIMCFLEILTVIAMFVFARKIRYGNPIDLEKQIYGIHRTIIETTPLLYSPWKLKAVLTDAYFSYRMTVYVGCIENDKDSFCYRIEVFDKNFNLKFLGESEVFEGAAYFEMFKKCLDITTTFTS